jgi:aryl sulfotransferase
MNILQVSPPKAGSFWLHTILKNILEHKNIPVSSYIEQQPVFEELEQEKLSFKEQAGVDMLDIEEEGNFCRVSSIYREEIKDLSNYSSKATLAWTHSTYCSTTHNVFEHFEKKVIIVRDPRDRALSAARFAFTPYMKEHYPSPYTSPEDFLNGEYERLLEQWVWFYGNYLLHQKELDLHFVFYERLLKDFQSELDDLLNYLQLDLTASEKAEVEKAVSFSNMKKKSPRHLQKGKRRKWVEQLSNKQKDLALNKAGFLLKLFDYPLSAPEEYSIPGFPEKIPKKELLNRLQQIDWRELYGNPEKASG